MIGCHMGSRAHRLVAIDISMISVP